MDNMDKSDNKYATVFDIIENPQKYTQEQLKEMLSDTETRDIYNLICKSESAIESSKTVDVDAEWEKFARIHEAHKRSNFIWRSSRAASIVMIICTSIAAIAAGIAITIAVNNHYQKTTGEKTSIPTNISTDSPEASATEPQDSITVATMPVMFEDGSLADIMKTIAATYGVEIKFNNKETEFLHLYYRFDPSLTIDEVISQLNTFDQINIIHSGNTLTIE